MEKHCDTCEESTCNGIDAGDFPSQKDAIKDSLIRRVRWYIRVSRNHAYVPTHMIDKLLKKLDAVGDNPHGRPQTPK